MRNGEVLWKGKAQNADGDLSESKLSNVHLVHRPNSEGEHLHIHAKFGEMHFDSGSADFSEVLVQRAISAKPGEAAAVKDDSGGIISTTLTTPSASYSEKQQQLVAKGPVVLSGPALDITATGARMDVETQTIDLEGPIEGSWTPGAQ